MNDTAPAPRRSHWLRWLATGVVVVAGLIWLAGFLGRRGVNDQLAALRARGEKLTFEELAIPWLTNGAPRTKAMVDAINSIRTKPSAMGSAAMMELVAPGRARTVFAGDSLSIGSTNAVAWADLEAEMTAIEPQLGILRDALADPETDFGVNPVTFLGAGGYRRPYVEMRMSAQLLALDVVRCLHSRRLPRAAASLHALAQMVHLHEREPTLVAQMVNVAILGLGLTATWEALQAPGWTDDQLAAMQRDWESVDVPAMMERAFVGERASGLAYFNLVRTRSPEAVRGIVAGAPPGSVSVIRLLVESLQQPFKRLLIFPADERLFVTVAQARVDYVRLLAQGRPAMEIQKRLAVDEADLVRTLDSWRGIRYPITSMVLPNANRATETAVRNMALLRLGLTAIALERYRLRHLAYPETLAALVPGVIRSVPEDPIDGRPLRYRAEPAGGFRLWSVGTDGGDQGGDPSRLGSGQGSMLLWQGRDFVWPTAASKEEVAAFDREQVERAGRNAKSRGYGLKVAAPGSK